jgi:Tfp pilus assembly protein PilF
VAQAVAREIEIAVSPEETARLASARSVNPEAYENYLKGMFHYQKLTPPDLEAALSYFEIALEKDPGYALPYAGIARVWGGRNQMGYVPAHEAVPNQQAAVQRALELDDSLAEAHLSLASLKTWGEWDWPSAERAFERALELNPNYADARNLYSHFLNIMGRPDEAMVQIERALELDPFNDLYQALYGVDLTVVRRNDEAIEQFRSALRTAPGNPVALIRLSATLHLEGMYEEALEAQRSFLAAVRDREGQEALERGFEESGYAGAMRHLADAMAARSLRTGTRAFEVAVLYVRAGETELALDWLERAFVDRDPNLAALGAAPEIDPIRDDPRCQDLLRRMNLPL